MTENLIPITNLIVSIATLLLGYLAYNKFLVKDLASHQLELVIELVEKIHRNNIPLKSVNNKNGHVFTSRFDNNLFQLSNVYGLEKESLILCKPINCEFIFDPYEYLNNPILPKEISKSLWKIYNSFNMDEIKLEEVESYFAIGNLKKNLKEKEYLFALVFYSGGLNEFVSDSVRLVKSITTWLHKYGIKDINEEILSREFKYR